MDNQSNMIDIWTQTEIFLRLTSFFGVLLLMAVWEVIAPLRQLTISKPKRWFSNLLILVLNGAIIRVLFPTAAVGMALYAQQQHWGLLNLVSLPPLFSILISVVLLDLVIYGQHVMFHAVPVLWRLHRMHHVDLDFDVTTGVRFHPIEIVLSLLIKFVAIIFLGAPAVAVLIFQIALNGITMFNHGNVRMPAFLDKIIRFIIVTPYMHRVHHSEIPNETNSNFGFNLSIWDRLFGTYRQQPKLGYQKMTVGIKEIHEPKYCAGLWGMLKLPFIRF